MEVYNTATSVPPRTSVALVPAATPMYNIGVMNMTDHYPFVDHGLQKVFISGDLELIAFAFPSAQLLDPNIVGDTNDFRTTGQTAVANCGTCHTDALVYDSQDKPEWAESSNFYGNSCFYALCTKCNLLDRFSMDTYTYKINRVHSGRHHGNQPPILVPPVAQPTASDPIFDRDPWSSSNVSGFEIVDAPVYNLATDSSSSDEVEHFQDPYPIPSDYEIRPDECPHCKHEISTQVDQTKR